MFPFIKIENAIEDIKNGRMLIVVVERVPLIMETNVYDERYFKTKKEKMGHLL